MGRTSAHCRVPGWRGRHCRPGGRGRKARADGRLVHGSFADGSSWSPVVNRLHKRGYPVIAAANPLRGLGIDSAYLKNRLAQIEGPIVLVGHPYGDFVMTNAATGNPQCEGARLHPRGRAGAG